MKVPYWAEDQVIEPAKAGPLGGILLWCAGVDRSLLRTPAEAMRYSGLGALVAAVACLGATTFTIFASVVVGHFAWPLAVFGVAWGSVILLIDRAIVTEPHYRLNDARAALLADGHGTAQFASGQGERRDPEPVGELTLPLLNQAGELPTADRASGAESANEEQGANGTGSANGAERANGTGPASARSAADPRYAVPGLTAMHLPRDRVGWHVRGLIYLTRLVITACIAYLVAEAAMLLIFHPEVKQELSQIHPAQFQSARAAAINQAVDQEQGPLSTLRTNWKNANQAVAGEQQQLAADQKKAAEEQQGVLGPNSSGVPGAGAQWNQDNGIVLADEKTLTAREADAAKAETAYSTLNTELEQAKAADPKALAALHVPSLTDIYNDTYGDNGLNAQEQAFDAFVAAHPGDLLANAGPWVLRVLLVAIDLVPLGTKLLNRYTLYGRRMSERALIIRYHDMVRDTAALRDIDRQADIHAMHSRHHFDVEAERAGFHRWWRMAHLRPGKADSTWRT